MALSNVTLFNGDNKKFWAHPLHGIQAKRLLSIAQEGSNGVISNPHEALHINREKFLR